jgi:hypothetical protein
MPADGPAWCSLHHAFLLHMVCVLPNPDSRIASPEHLAGAKKSMLVSMQVIWQHSYSVLLCTHADTKFANEGFPAVCPSLDAM